MISAMNSALGGMQRNLLDFQRHSERIAQWGSQANDSMQRAEPSIQLPDEIVGTLSARAGYEASLAVLKIEDEMTGTLLDVLA